MWNIGRRRPRTFVLGVEVDRFPEVAPEVGRGRALRITEIGEAVLHTPAATVTELSTPELAGLIDDMFTTMEVAEGVGLAAPQVGVGLRVFVYDLEDEQGDRHVGHVVNPVLEVDDARVVTDDEGCLSVPGAYEPLARPTRAVVRGTDQHGTPVVLEGVDFLARAFVHECQHLDGTLYTDHLTAAQREDAMRQVREERPLVLASRRELSVDLGVDPAEYPEQPPRLPA